MNPENLDARMGLLQFYLMAPVIMGGSKDKAREQAGEIMKRNAHQGHLALGFIRSVNEEYDLAQREYQAAIALDSRNTQPYYSLGYLYTRQKQFDKATEIFENFSKS